RKESSAMNNDITSRDPLISPEALALLGGGKIAYLKMVRSEDVQRQFPQAPELAPGTMLYALHAADGTPIMLTDSREAPSANAWSQELQTGSVHCADERTGRTSEAARGRRTAGHPQDLVRLHATLRVLSLGVAPATRRKPRQMQVCLNSSSIRR